MIRRKYTVADFFSGCGGLSLGLSLTRRFETLLGSDINSDALETFGSNHVDDDGNSPITLNEDIRKVSVTAIRKMLKRGRLGESHVDCLVGGPPCEGFSQNRSINSGGAVKFGSASRVHGFLNDPRNELFKWFVELAAELQPKVILIENVPDLVRHKGGETLSEVLGSLDKAGYIATARVLNAADFGVPQMRRRAIFLAQRKQDLSKTHSRLSFPAASHAPFPLQNLSLDAESNWLPGDAGYWPTVREALGDLPAPSKDTLPIKADYSSHAATSLRRFLQSSGEIHNHIARPLGKSGLQKVKALSTRQRAADLPDDLRPRASYHYSYSRLRWSEPARTITKFCYHVGSGMFAHPTEDRAITMREAARLQTFPDSFRFCSDNIRTLSSLIGSAVPPLLAYRLAQSICRYLDALQFSELAPADRKLVRAQATDAVLQRMHNKEWSSDPSDELPLLKGS